MKIMQVSREHVIEMAELAIEKAVLPGDDAEKIRAVVKRESHFAAFVFSVEGRNLDIGRSVKCPACAATHPRTVNAIRMMSESMARFTKHWDNVVTLEVGRTYRDGLVIEVKD